MEQVLNELSFSGAHELKHSALEAIRKLCLASKELNSLGFKDTIKTSQLLGSLEISKGYTFENFITDRGLPSTCREERSFMLSKCTRSPFIEELHAEYQIEEIEECCFEDEPCHGLALAFIWGIPALSLAGDIRFDGDRVGFAKRTLSQDYVLVEKNCTVLTLKDASGVTLHEEEIRNCLMPNITEGNDVIENAENCFPFLEFCGDAPRQLRNMLRGTPYFPAVVKILTELNIAMRKYSDGTNDLFLPENIYYQPVESESVNNSTFLRGLRTFLCNDNVSRYFQEHIRINQAKRIHICSDCTLKKIFVGYIGEHLPTARF